jgi:glyoxylase-like metal-dependent hydrolase (beta-lactamase superfamily II)
MEPLRDDVHVIPLTPRYAINAYMIGDVLVDAGLASSAKSVLAAVAGRPVGAHALTHAHPDHAGGSRTVAQQLGIPVWVGARDAAATEAGTSEAADVKLKPVLARARFDGVPVDRRLGEGDEIGHGFVVLDVPGHSPGHVAYWRESDRTLIAGDVYFNLHLLTLRYGLRPPPGPFTVDREENRRSMRRLAELEPDIVGFGHGAPLRDAAPKLRAFVAGL